MLHSSKSPERLSFIANPFNDYSHSHSAYPPKDSSYTPTFHSTTNDSSKLHIVNPFKEDMFSSRLKFKSESSSSESSRNLFNIPEFNSLPTSSTEWLGALQGRDKMAHTLFEKCNLIREKTKELADLAFQQTQLRSKHHAKIIEMDKKNAVAREELQRHEASLAAIASIEKESEDISSRISYLRDNKKKLEEDLHHKGEQKRIRQQQINETIKQNQVRIEQLKHEIANKDAQKKALQVELHNKTASLGASTVDTDLSNASELLAKKRMLTESNKKRLSDEQNRLMEKNDLLKEHTANITSSMDHLRKIKALNDRLKVLTSNFRDRVILSQAGKISNIEESIENRSTASILKDSIDRISSAVKSAKTHLMSHQSTIEKYRESLSRLSNSIAGDSSENDLKEKSQKIKEVFANFCDSRREYTHLDLSSALPESEIKNKVSIEAEKSTFDAQAGLNLILNADSPKKEAKDHMNDPSIFHAESIWVFQEPKSEVFEQPHHAVEVSDLDFLHETKQPETTDYTLPDNESLRTPSRKRPYPQPVSEPPFDASVALFDWESVLPPSPHDKPKPELSMDFLHD